MSTKFCTGCGQKNVSNAKYCFGCGDSFSEMTPDIEVAKVSKPVPKPSAPVYSKPSSSRRVSRQEDDISVEEAQDILNNVDEAQITNFFIQEVISESGSSGVKGVKFEDVARGEKSNRKSLQKRKSDCPKNAKEILKSTVNKRRSND